MLFQFKEMLSILSSFLSAGYSIENALTASIPDLSQLIGAKSYMVEELMQIQRSLTMNRPLEESLSDFANRSGLKYFWSQNVPEANSPPSSNIALPSFTIS